ncbi:L,D-transpeptidase [bacterium]|nr:L,D-transpeptidase [bacterium]
MSLSRRGFLRLFGVSIPGLLGNIYRFDRVLGEFPETDFLSRVTEPQVNIRARPDVNSLEVGKLYQDQVVPHLREVIGSNPYRPSQRWVETPYGFVWSPLLQPVKNVLNAPITILPETTLGTGMWVEVTVPWVEVILDNPSPIAPRIEYLIENSITPKLYYSQIIWVDDIKQDDTGQVWYHLKEPYGSYGDVFWAPAEAFKPISLEDSAPINPEVENKRIDVNIHRQTLSCFENDREVYYCRVSTGRLDQETPIGQYFQIFWKLISVHMSAGTAGAGYDLIGVGWPTFFAPNGIAIHSTFWHNDFGAPTSAGCVNAKPDDAKFVSRWTSPIVPYDPGMVDIGSTGIPSTIVRVIEA